VRCQSRNRRTAAGPTAKQGYNTAWKASRARLARKDDEPCTGRALEARASSTETEARSAWHQMAMLPNGTVKGPGPASVPGSLSLSGQSLCNCIAHFLSEPFPARPFLSWPLHIPLSASSPFHTPVKQSHGSWLAPTARLDRQAQANSLMQSARAFNARAIACTLPLLCDRGTCVPLLCDRGTCGWSRPRTGTLSWHRP